jgi:hypothetical protein
MNMSQVWWHMIVIIALGRQRQENHEFKSSLGYIGGLCLKNKMKQKSLANKQGIKVSCGNYY